MPASDDRERRGSVANENKTLGEQFRDAFRTGWEQGRQRDQRKKQTRRLVLTRQLETQEQRLRTMLAGLAEGRDDVSRDDLAVELDVWRELHGDLQKTCD